MRPSRREGLQNSDMIAGRLRPQLVLRCSAFWGQQRQLSKIRGASSLRTLPPSVKFLPYALGNGKSNGITEVHPEARPLGLQRRVQVEWQPGTPTTVLLIKKPRNPKASARLQEIGRWLQKQKMRVFVERGVHHTEFSEFEIFEANQHVDLGISLGGDGTVLHLASLFTEDIPLPPIVSFAMGTLGFLTPFEVEDFEDILQRVLDANSQTVYCTLRTRKRCEVLTGGQVTATHHVLNECLLDRGASPSMVSMECFIDSYHLTNIIADGLIISTPSGSTAYSMSAGGPMVAPSVPASLLTPIAPQSLSFRPLIVPESSIIEIRIPSTSRTHARASFDGRHPLRLLRGSYLRCSTSFCALPMISLGLQEAEWFQGITQKLKWNSSPAEFIHPSQSIDHDHGGLVQKS